MGEFLYYGVPTLLLVTPLVARKRLWLVSYALSVGGVILALHLEHYVNYHDGGGGTALGEVMLLLWEIGFGLGLALRAVEWMFRCAARSRLTSVPEALLIVVLATAFSFSVASLLLVVLPLWQSNISMERDLLRFAQSSWLYFVAFWAVASLLVIGYPLAFRIARQIRSRGRAKTNAAERNRRGMS